MAMTDIPVTTLFMANSTTSGISTTTPNGTDDWRAALIDWPGGDLTRAALICTAVSGSPVATVQLFNVDTTDGTVTPVNTASPVGAAVDTGTLVANQLEIVTGIGQASLAAGIYALRVVFKSGTSFTLSAAHTGSRIYSVGQHPMGVSVTNGAAQVRLSIVGAMFAVGDATTWTQIPSLTPPFTFTATSFNSGSTPDEYGLWVPVNPWPVDVRILGVVLPDNVNTRPDVRVAFYSGTLAAPSQDLSFTIDRDITQTGAAGGAIYRFTSPQTVLFGNPFGIGFRAMTGENLAVTYYDFGVGNESLMDAYWGRNATLFTRSGGSGVLTQVTYQTPLINPLVNGMNPVSGASGSAGIIGHAGLGYWPMIRPNSKRRTAKWGNRG